MTRTNKGKRSKPKNGYEYLGEFIWLSGLIEQCVDKIFLALFDLNPPTAAGVPVRFMFIGLIDTRKKLKLIEVGFAQKGDQTRKTLLREVHELYDLRNVLVHSHLEVEQEHISIDHITGHGKYYENNQMSYEDFERVFQRQKAILDQLGELEETTPISSFSREAIAAIDEIIDSSPNVVRYVRTKPKNDT